MLFDGVIVNPETRAAVRRDIKRRKVAKKVAQSRPRNDHPWRVETDKARFHLVDMAPGRPVNGDDSAGPDFYDFCPIGTCPDHGVQPVIGFHTTPGSDPTTFPTLACGGMDPEQF